MKRRLAPLCIAAAALLAAPAAHANGDPASDVLPFKTVFLSAQEPSSTAFGRELLGLTAESAKKQVPIRVAVIYQQSDLGLIQSLWRKPQTYANFLGKELIAFGRYHGTLLVAMPDGFGVFGPGATPKAKRELLHAKSGGHTLDDLGNEAAAAVRLVAAASGVELAAPKTGSGTRAWLIVLAVLAGAAVVAAGVFFALRRWLTAPAA